MKITVNQLRKIIREEVQKTIRLNEGLDNEQIATLDKLKKLGVHFPDANLTVLNLPGNIADALVTRYSDSRYYGGLLKIVGAPAFNTPEAITAIMYMFPNADRRTVMQGCEIADQKSGKVSIPKLPDAVGFRFKP